MELRKNLSISQKLNVIFGLFLISTRLSRIPEMLNDWESFASDALVSSSVLLGIGILFLVLARWDLVVVRYFQFFLFYAISIIVVLTNDDSSNVSAYVMLAIAVFSAYKMNLFGGAKNVVVLIAIALSVGLTFVAGETHGFSMLQRLNFVLFIAAFGAILYVLFEEEIEELQKHGQELEKNIRDLMPFAELGENAAGVVHDFKGDVQVLSAIVELEEADGATQTTERLRSVADRLNKRVQSIMYIANAQSIQEPEDVNLHELVDSAMYYFAGVNRYLKHAVTYEVRGDNSLTVRARRGSILVIVENIIKNSIEATDGMPRRRITATVSGEQDHAVLTLENTGRPLPFQTREPINVLKSPHFRRGRSSKSGGAGIGMVNVKTALKSLGAAMVMQNTGNGVRSEISIPYTTKEVEQAAETGDKLAAAAGVSGS